MIKDIYYIRPISYKKALQMIVQHHYLHRAAPCSFAFGLCQKSDHKVVGVVIYGTPSSAPLRGGICGKEESSNVLELTRLWIEDGTPKNSESFLIGNTIPLLNKEIIVSYAEIDAGHIGIVYQATNWLYTGLSDKHSKWVVEGIDLHYQTLADKYSKKEIIERYGDRFSLKERSRKHRYIYFNAKGCRKKELLGKLKYKIEPYPKHIPITIP